MRKGISVLAVLAAVAACSSPQPDPAPGGPREVYIIVDADRHGAIVLSGPDFLFSGVRSDGSIAWRQPVSAHGPDPVACLARCPDAILSGSTEAQNSAQTPDPPPELRIGAQPVRLAVPESVKRRVLAAAGAEDYLLAAGDADGAGWLEQHRGAQVVRHAMPGPGPTWKVSHDGTIALAIANGEARWFALREGWWRPQGDPAQVRGTSACLSPDGNRAITLGLSPMMLHHNEPPSAVTDLRHASSCAWGPSAVLVAEYAQSAGRGVTTRLRLAAPDGTVKWGTELAGEVAVAADPTGSRMSYVDKTGLVEMDAETRAVLRRIPDARGAHYDGEGGLVVVLSGGSVSWLS